MSNNRSRKALLEAHILFHKHTKYLIGASKLLNISRDRLLETIDHARENATCHEVWLNNLSNDMHIETHQNPAGYESEYVKLLRGRAGRDQRVRYIYDILKQRIIDYDEYKKIRKLRIQDVSNTEFRCPFCHNLYAVIDVNNEFHWELENYCEHYIGSDCESPEGYDYWEEDNINEYKEIFYSKYGYEPDPPDLVMCALNWYKSVKIEKPTNNQDYMVLVNSTDELIDFIVEEARSGNFFGYGDRQ